jgi:hypothetical protein
MIVILSRSVPSISSNRPGELGSRLLRAGILNSPEPISESGTFRELFHCLLGEKASIFCHPLVFSLVPLAGAVKRLKEVTPDSKQGREYRVSPYVDGRGAEKSLRCRFAVI